MDAVDRPRDNASRALAEIRKIIVVGAVAADGRLPTERELSERLDVGRRSVRRALEALEAEGLIWRRQGKGTFIGQPPDPTGVLAAELVGVADILSVMEARLALEPALAGLAARRATGEDVARLKHLSVRVTDSADSESAELWDGALHRMIARIAGNRVLLTMFALLDEVRMGDEWQARRHRARTPETLEKYDSQHRAIVAAIEARDEQAARSAMTDHIRTLSENLERSLTPAEAGA